MSKDCKNRYELAEKLQEVKEELNECRFNRNLAQLEAHQYKRALDEIEECIKDSICQEECNYNWEKPCPDCDCRYNDIIDIINKTKEVKNEINKKSKAKMV